MPAGRQKARGPPLANTPGFAIGDQSSCPRACGQDDWDLPRCRSVVLPHTRSAARAQDLVAQVGPVIACGVGALDAKQHLMNVEGVKRRAAALPGRPRVQDLVPVAHARRWSSCHASSSRSTQGPAPRGLRARQAETTISSMNALPRGGSWRRSSASLLPKGLPTRRGARFFLAVAWEPRNDVLLRRLTRLEAKAQHLRTRRRACPCACRLLSSPRPGLPTTRQRRSGSCRRPHPLLSPRSPCPARRARR